MPKGFQATLLACVIAVIFVVSYITSLQMNLARKNEQLKTVRTQKERQIEENKEKEALLQSGDDKEILERIARDELGYVAPNERIFYDASGN